MQDQLTVDNVSHDFLLSITDAQVSANKGWNPDNTDLIDKRVVACEQCKAPGMNTCYGYWAFECGAQIGSDGEEHEPCGSAT